MFENHLKSLTLAKSKLDHFWGILALCVEHHEDVISLVVIGENSITVTLYSIQGYTTLSHISELS